LARSQALKSAPYLAVPSAGDLELLSLQEDGFSSLHGLAGRLSHSTGVALWSRGGRTAATLDAPPKQQLSAAAQFSLVWDSSDEDGRRSLGAVNARGSHAVVSLRAWTAEDELKASIASVFASAINQAVNYYARCLGLRGVAVSPPGSLAPSSPMASVQRLRPT